MLHISERETWQTDMKNLLLARNRSLLLWLTIALVLMFYRPAPCPAQMQKTFTPRLSVQEQYDDNVDLDSRDERSDWITTVSPGFLLELDLEKTRMGLDYQAGFAFYANDSSRNTINHHARLDLNQALAQHLTLNVRDAFSRTEDPITEQDQRISSSRNRRVRYRNDGEANLAYQFGPDDVVTTGYRNRYFDSRSRDEEDSTGNEGFVNVDTWFGPRFGMGLNAQYGRAQFKQPNNYTGDVTEDFKQYQAGTTLRYRWRPGRLTYCGYSLIYQDYERSSRKSNYDDFYLHQGTVGVNLLLAPHTTLDAEGGYYYQDYDRGQSRNGGLFNVALSTRREKAAFRVSGSGGYTQDYFTAENQGFTRYYQVSGSASYKLSEDLGVFAAGRYRWEDIYGQNDRKTRDDKVWQASGGFNYSFWRYLTLSLEGMHTERDSTDKRNTNRDYNDYTDNRVTLRLTAAYPIPF